MPLPQSFYNAGLTRARMGVGKKVLVVCDKTPCTSFGRLTLDSLEALKQTGYEAEILWLSNRYSGFFTNRKKIANLLTEKSFDIVFLIHSGIGYLIPKIRTLLPSSKIVVMVHDIFWQTLHPLSPKYFLFRWLFANPSRNADAFIFNSLYTQKESDRYFGKTKLSAIVGCPIHEGLFFRKENCLSRAERLNFWEKCGVSGYRGVCLNVSLDEPRKNLNVFFKVASRNPDVAFVRVGHLLPGTQKKLKGLNLSNVYHFTDISDELLVDFYRNADLMIYPSLVEGFGLPPIEAIACGTPAVAVETSALEENLKGVVPLLKDPEDVEGFSSVLRQALNGEKLINDEAAKKLLDSCSLHAYADRLSNFFKTV